VVWTIWWDQGHTRPMSAYSLDKAKDRLPELIDRAQKGEAVVITRHGTPVAELRPIPAPPRRITQADQEWLAARRATRPKTTVDAGTLVSGVRDEEQR